MLYCRDLPSTVKLTNTDGRNLELLGWQVDVGALSYWYLTASGAGPVFVIFDTAAPNAVMKKFASFGAAPGGSQGAEAGVDLGIVSSAMTGPDRYVLGSFKVLTAAVFKDLMSPQLIKRLPPSVDVVPLDGVYTVSPGPTFGIVGKAPDLASQFLKFMVDAQK